MQLYLPYLEWIDQQKEEMISHVLDWSNINTYSKNLYGLQQQLSKLISAFSCLEGTLSTIALPEIVEYVKDGIQKTALGHALHITKRANAKVKILFSGHMDTVFSQNDRFQKACRKNNMLYGPGVLDMKGGLVILLYAIKAFERSPYKDSLGLEIIITPDEEIGSIGSKALLHQLASKNHLGLIFEPENDHSEYITSRGGSCNFIVRAFGKEAHAGRDFFKGHSANHTLCLYLAKILSYIKQLENAAITINIGEIHGGHTFNVMSDYAQAKVNLRATTPELFQTTYQKILQDIDIFSTTQYPLEIHEISRRTPYILEQYSPAIINHLANTAELLDMPFVTTSSMGVSDANTLNEYGLVTLDSMGARGKNIHTEEEELSCDSLTEKAKLVALFLMRIARGEIEIDNLRTQKISGVK